MLVFSTHGGIVAMDLKTPALKKIVTGKVHLLFAGRRTGAVYFENGDKGRKAISFMVQPTSARWKSPRRISRKNIME